MKDHRLEGDFYAYLHRFDQADEAQNQEVLAFYLPYFEGCQRVLDIGCGRGQFLQLLEAAGIDAVGIDLDSRMIEICRQRAFDVEESDLFDYLPEHRGEFDGIFSSNLIEHLSSQDATRFVHLSFEALAPGGVFLTATPNPESLVVHLHEFWRDATHVRPYNRVLLEFLLSWAGFDDITSGGNARTAWTPSEDLRAVPDLLGDMAPQNYGSWNLAFPKVMEPSESVPENSTLRRMVFSLRRRLARFLARTVLFEEFAAVSDGFDQATRELSRVARELKTLAGTSSRVDRAIYEAQIKPLVAPREVFATGVRLVDEAKEREA